MNRRVARLQASRQGVVQIVSQRADANVSLVFDPPRPPSECGSPNVNICLGRFEIFFGICICPIDNCKGAPILSQSVLGTRHWELTLRPGSARGLLLVVCAAVCSLSVTSCSASPSSAPTTTKSDPSSTATSSTTAADGQIISAWLAAQKAFHDAALTSDPNAPELAATTIPPILDTVRANLAQSRAQGDIAKGPSRWGSPHITARGTAGTEIVSCIYDGEIGIVAKTGEPVPGIAGEANFAVVTSIMQLTATGWKLADQNVESGKCGAS